MERIKGEDYPQPKYEARFVQLSGREELKKFVFEEEHANRVCYDMSPKPLATIEFE